jgi:hypothetical protein
MSEAKREQHISTKCPVLIHLVKPTEGTPCYWAYCTVCKKLSYSSAGDNPDKWLKKHSTKDCLKKWDCVSYLFQGGLVKHVQPRQYVDSSGKKDLEKQVEYLKEMLEKIRTDLEDARRPLLTTHKREETCDFALGNIICYIDEGIDGTGAEKKEEEEEED